MEHDTAHNEPFCWKHLFFLPRLTGPKDLLSAIGYSTVLSLSIVYMLPGASAGLVILAVAAHGCTILILRGAL